MMQKRLYRSDSEKMLFGVCGGLAAYFSVDPTIVRVAFVLGALLNGIGIILYLIMAIVVPREPGPERNSTPSSPAQPTSDTTPSSSPPPTEPTQPGTDQPPTSEDEAPRA